MKKIRAHVRLELGVQNMDNNGDATLRQLQRKELDEKRRTLAAYESGHIIGTRTGPQMATRHDHDAQVSELKEQIADLERRLREAGNP